MADPVSDIEVELRRSITLSDAKEQRKKLNERFSQLSPDQAKILLEKILTLDGSRLPYDFRRLARAVRLELLLRLAGRLGTQSARQLHARLTARGEQGDPVLQRGLRVAFPDTMPELRGQFVDALGKQSPAGVPTVLLTFRSDDKPLSPDNQCSSRKLKRTGQSIVPHRLGLDPDPESGLNWMEIRGTVSGHHSDAQYRFRRTIEKAKFYLAGQNGWRCVEHRPAGTDDDVTDSDEDTHPDNDHIYVIDSPGFTTIPPLLHDIPAADRPNVTQYVFMMNALEMVDVKVGTRPWTKAGSLEWFSVTWLEKTGGKWGRKPGNKIEKGSIADLEIAATTIGQPPTAF